MPSTVGRTFSTTLKPCGNFDIVLATICPAFLSATPRRTRRLAICCATPHQPLRARRARGSTVCTYSSDADGRPPAICGACLTALCCACAVTMLGLCCDCDCADRGPICDPTFIPIHGGAICVCVSGGGPGAQGRARPCARVHAAGYRRALPAEPVGPRGAVRGGLGLGLLPLRLSHRTEKPNSTRHEKY